jgi:hypothetical protein
LELIGMSSVKSRKSMVYTIPGSRQKVQSKTSVLQDVDNRLTPNAILEGMQTTASENHPDFVALQKSLRQGLPSPVPHGRDWGGEFTMNRTWIESPEPANYRTESLFFDSPTFGTIVKVTKWFPLYMRLNYGAGIWPPSVASSLSALNAFGTVAISRCSPTNPVAQLSVATLEGYKDGLPSLLGHSLWEERTNLARGAGSEYLNSEFGWKPLVSDVKSFAYGVANMGDLNNQFFRDAGKPVRRRYSFPSQVSVQSDVINAKAQYGGPFDTGTLDQVRPFLTSQITRDRRITVDRWFSGAFTYHAPPELFGDAGAHAARAVEILGMDLNPSTLWEAAPWSWAADWFSNTGDVLNNLNNYSQYGQVLKYGYIMEHSVCRDTYTQDGIPNGGFDPTKVSFTGHPNSFVICSETKIRRRASPFGFGVSLGSLTPAQIAIIGALGLSMLA